MYRVGVDIGGTFTDVVVASDDGEIVRAKALTTPADYTEGVVAALGNATEGLEVSLEALISDCESVVNGTTVVTNAIAQHRGRHVGLLTTAGFKQQIYIHRGVRQVQLDLQKDVRPPDILRLRDVSEIHERVDRSGVVLRALDRAEVEREVRRLVEDEGVEALAVCFLWSFRNPEHERAAREVISALYPELFVTLSSEIYPRIREYERMNTALLNAFVSEGAETYISKLGRELDRLGLQSGRLAFMQSLGGHIAGAEAVVEPIRLSHSGPVGGVVAASHFASLLGEANVITADLGGTSFDTALIRDGRATYAHRTRINRLLTGLSTVDIHAIGAGGGSIAWVDERGIPQMGPHSSGADPGPACYGKGGTEATITDANLILGMIDPLNFWGGAVTLDVEAARRALEPLAERIGATVEDLAAGLHEIAVTQMATAMATVSLGRGYDPRDFAVIGFGGASGLFLAEVCGQLGIRKLIMPRAAATFSAYGLLFADAVHSFATTAEWSLQVGSVDEINALYARLEEQARRALQAAGFVERDVTVVLEADLKWVSQSFEISIAMPADALTEDDREPLIASFIEEYERVYGAGTAWQGFPIQLHTARVVATGKTPKPPIPEVQVEPQDSATARSGARRIRLTGGAEVDAAIYDGPSLLPGMQLSGPALIDDVDTTLYAPQGAELEIDRFGNYVFRLGDTPVATPERLALQAPPEREAPMSNATAYDPVLAQVIQRRLEVVCQEAAITLNRTSGSPIVTEGNDFSTSLIAPDGEVIAFSSYLPVHFVSSMNAIRDLLGTVDLSTVEPGDHFAANDPNTTAPLHSADPNVLTPIFADGEIVAWAFSTVHVFDIGGLTPGGWIPGSYDRYGEGLIFPLIKIVSKGAWDDNFVKIYLANVRVPQSLNDLRSCVAANNTATERFAEVVDRYGVATVHEYAATNIRLTEQLARRRIDGLPDGAYQAVDWVEYDGHGDDRLHRLSVTITVRGDELVIDVSDSPPQLNSFSNATRAGLLGWIVGDLIRTLFPDLPINAGITKPLRLIQAPVGTMLNPSKDAATSAGHMESGSKVMRAFHEALQKAVQLSDSPELRRRAAALGGSVAPHNVVAGQNDAGHPEIWVSLDSLGTGLGAQANVDGRDAGCYEDMTASMLLDTELEETASALHYYRRLRPNSGGHGYRRGGLAIDTAWRLYGMDSVQLTAFSNLTRVPTRSPGGGYPGGGTGNVIFRNRLAGREDASILAPADVESGGEVPPSHATNLPLGGTDVVRAFCAGGCGLGDPLFREPYLVAADLENEQITADVAEAVYGVVLRPDGSPDEESTVRRRREIRAQRLGTEPRREPEPMSEYRSALRVEGDSFACNHCGEPLGPAAGNWKEQAAARSWPLADRAGYLGIHLRPSPEPLRLWELCCPGCGSLLEVNVYEEGEQPLHDIRLGETTDAQGEPF